MQPSVVHMEQCSGCSPPSPSIGSVSVSFRLPLSRPPQSIQIHCLTAHFSENWGVLCLASLFGGNVFSIMFGRNLDAHESTSTPGQTSGTVRMLSKRLASLALRAGLPDDRQCFDGRACYISSIHVTTGACTLALVLSLWAALRNRKQTMEKLHDEVLWEEEEEVPASLHI